MKAVIRSTYGSPDVLAIKNMDRPVPGANEVLVRVYATTVNRTDCAILSGKPFIIRFFTGLFKPRASIPGTDFSGVIESVGKNVTVFNVGDRVWGFDDIGLGSQAEYLKIGEGKPLTTIPDNISFEQAAASAEAAHYAYNMIKKVKLQSGQKVLVNGATGGIGSAALQMLKYFDADVTAVCDTKNIELIKSLGADRVIDYLKEDFTKGNHTYNFIFDAVGKSSFSKCKPLLQPGGIYISSELGEMIQNPLLALVTPFMGNKKVIFPIPTDIKASLRFIKNLLEKEKFKPVIEREYPLAKIQEAYSYVASGKKTGNVIVMMSDQ